MPSWQIALSARLARLIKPRVTPATVELADLRRQYDYMTERYGALAPDAIIERAQLGTVKGEWMRVDETQPQKLILYLHGGGYISGSPETHRPLVARLCKAAGSAALSLAYRLAPEYPFPAGLRDAMDAYRFLVNKGFPPQSIVLAGDGSGGGLAFATLLAIRNAGLAMPAGCVAMSPWADLALSGWSMLQNSLNDVVLSWEMLFVSARHYLKGANPADPYASPIFGNFRDFPPIMVHAGSLELLRDDAARIGEKAAEANVPVSVEIYDGMHHVFQAYPHAPEAKVSLSRIGQFIRSRTPSSVQGLDFAKSAARGGAA
ncbi:MAG: alpha/beta hydrolase [Alphaproteobacteria bacterium]